MSEKYEYFRKDIVLSGKHAMYVDDMWVQNEIQKSYFKRLVDLITIAPVVGLRAKHMAEPDNKGEKKRTIQLAQIMTRREDLLTILQMVLLLDESSGLTVEQKIDRTFKGPFTEDEFKSNSDLFMRYLLGGIEVMYEQLVQRRVGIEDDYSDQRIANIIALLDYQF